MSLRDKLKNRRV